MVSILWTLMEPRAGFDPATSALPRRCPNRLGHRGLILKPLCLTKLTVQAILNVSKGLHWNTSGKGTFITQNSENFVTQQNEVVKTMGFND